MPASEKHPTPWRVTDYGNVKDADDEYVCGALYDRETARRIVDAVNKAEGKETSDG